MHFIASGAAVLSLAVWLSWSAGQQQGAATSGRGVGSFTGSPSALGSRCCQGVGLSAAGAGVMVSRAARSPGCHGVGSRRRGVGLAALDGQQGRPAVGRGHIAARHPRARIEAPQCGGGLALKCGVGFGKRRVVVYVIFSELGFLGRWAPKPSSAAEKRKIGRKCRKRQGESRKNRSSRCSFSGKTALFSAKNC